MPRNCFAHPRSLRELGDEFGVAQRAVDDDRIKLEIASSRTDDHETRLGKPYSTPTSVDSYAFKRIDADLQIRICLSYKRANNFAGQVRVIWVEPYNRVRAE